MLYTQDLTRSPENGVVVKVFSGVEPEMELLFPADDMASISCPVSIDVGLEFVRLPWDCSQKFYVYFVMPTFINLAICLLGIGDKSLLSLG